MSILILPPGMMGHFPECDVIRGRGVVFGNFELYVVCKPGGGKDEKMKDIIERSYTILGCWNNDHLIWESMQKLKNDDCAGKI